VKFYTAHLRGDREPELIREGFSWGAAIFGPFWLFAHSAWIAGALVLVIDLLLGLVPGAPGLLAGFVSFWLLGLFGQDLRRWNLALRGYTMPHVIAARDAGAAESRLLTARPELLDRMS
jgi:hypothetical protein